MLAQLLHPSARLVWLCLLALPLLSACETGYLLQAARGQVAVLAARQPIARVVADPRTPASLRARLQQFAAARDFASRELGLPENRSYRSYVALRREFVVWNVIAAPEFSVAARHWCFPVAGCVPYRGYFRERSAQRYAERLRLRGDDVLVGGVPAYSTLGHFADPLLSSMLRDDDVTLIGTLFHELAHQRLYVPGDSVFNESFAMTVEEAGLVAWLRTVGRASELQRWQATQQRERQALQWIAAARDDLRRLYSQQLTTESMRQQKRERLAALQQQLTTLHAAARRSLNNADLALSDTYSLCVPGLQRELAALGGDLRRFYVRAAELARLPKTQRHAQVCARD